MTRIVSHELSKFGKIDIALHQKSEEYFEIIERHGLIENLKNIEHLGFISKSHPGNNHKRWDYVMLQFHILQKLKDPIFRAGLSSNHTIEGFTTSGLVLLQIAILFSNIGHLRGTLAAESALLDFLKFEDGQEAEFLNLVSQDADWNEYSRSIIDNEEYYKVKYLVALNFNLKHVDDGHINAVTKNFFQRAMLHDEVSLRKLKWVFLKIRQISFIYLDSFNSDFPFQVDITKILLNVVNYQSLFSPNSTDFEQFFDSCETTLTKRLYISPASTCALSENRSRYYDYLSREVLRAGANKLDMENFPVSLISRHVKPFVVSSSNGTYCYQYYLSQEDINLFGVKREMFNYSAATLENYSEKYDFNSLLNRGMTQKDNSVLLVHDQRKTLYFNNLIIRPETITEADQSQFFLNYFNVHLKFIEKYKFIGPSNFFKTLATIEFHKHYSRKVFLHLFRLLFRSEHRLSAYIKFENHQLIGELSRANPSFHVTGFMQSRSAFANWLTEQIAIEDIPRDIKNNYRIAHHIIRNVTSLSRYVSIFYCMFPVEVDRYSLSPASLYENRNPETVETLTDIDMTIAIFNGSKYEFYVIEGKKQAAGFEAAVRDDFENRIQPHLRHPNAMPEVTIVNQDGCKGGYICYGN